MPSTDKMVVTSYKRTDNCSQPFGRIGVTVREVNIKYRIISIKKVSYYKHEFL